jgi:hypothetical protein
VVPVQAKQHADSAPWGARFCSRQMNLAGGISSLPGTGSEA